MRQRRRHRRPGVSLVDDPSLHSAGLSLFTGSLSLSPSSPSPSTNSSLGYHALLLLLFSSPLLTLCPHLHAPRSLSISHLEQPDRSYPFRHVFSGAPTAMYSDYTLSRWTRELEELDAWNQSPSRSYEKASARFTGAPRMLGSGLSVLEDR